MNRDSEIIRILRFPLALLVVLLHAEPSIDGWNPHDMTLEYMGVNVAGIIMYSLSHILAQIAVPAFFLISGYLFFVKLEKWDYRVWKRKMVSRFSSIVVPYLICISIFAARHIFSHYQAGDLDSWLVGQGGLLNLFWASEHWRAGHTNIFGQAVMMSGPAAFHLWFLRDLIVAVLCTPILYLLFSTKNGRRRKWAFIWLGALCALDLMRVQIPLPGLSFSTLFYFGLGGFLSLNRLNLYSVFYKFRWALAILFAVLYCCLVPLDGSRSPLGTLIMPVENLLGVMCVINLASYLTTLHTSTEFLSRYGKFSFFMFVIHPFFLAIVWRLMTAGTYMLWGADNITSIEFVNSHSLLTLTLFFSKIAIAAVLSVLVYNVITRISPRFSRLICGR